MSWINTPDGKIVYGKRKILGIKVWLAPEGEDDDGEMFYSIWMQGKLNRRVPLKMNNEIAILTEHPAKMKAETFAFDPIAIAKCHGIMASFQKCPRCNKVQKVNVILSDNEAVPDMLECKICSMSFQYKS